MSDPSRAEAIRGWLQKELTALRVMGEESKKASERAEAIAEEAHEAVLREARRATKAARSLITKPVDAFSRVPAALVRDWIRSELLPDIVPRLYDIAMGSESFDHVVDDKERGYKVVRIGAPAAVQVAAGAALLNAGLARVPEEANPDELPGVYALGELELSHLQQVQAGPQPTNGHGNGAHAMLAAPNGSNPGVSETTGATLSDAAPFVKQVMAAPEPALEYVEIEEDATRPLDGHAPGEEPPPPPPPGPPTLEQQILAKRRARREANRGRRD